MKNIFFKVAILVILLSSCGNNSNKKKDTHTHEDGTEHIDHDNASSVAPEQKSFEIEHDFLSVKNDTLKSEHDKEHTHSHEDGHKH